MLEVKSLTKKFGNLTAISNLNFKVNKGEFISLIGPNGAGKTTLINIISGNMKPTSGEILFKGSNIEHKPAYELAQNGISRTYQITTIFSELTVFDNVRISLDRKLQTGLFDSIFRTKKFQDEEAGNEVRVLKILKKVGLQDKKNDIAGNLSHGDQRLLEIAIALGCEPGLLLLDEPVCGMNREEVKKTMRIIKEVWQKNELTIILVEHNMEAVMGVSERIIVLNDGRKVCDDTPESICENEEVIRIYLGDTKVEINN